MKTAGAYTPFTIIITVAKTMSPHHMPKQGVVKSHIMTTEILWGPLLDCLQLLRENTFLLYLIVLQFSDFMN